MIIAEIGYNHLGDASIANDYLDVLLETNIDAVTFQIREVSHREQTPEIYLNDEVFVDLFDKIKKAKKQVGIAIADIEYIDFFEKHNTDFYKVIRNDISNLDLINKLITTNKQILVSTGMSSEDEIMSFINHIKDSESNFKLIHTQLSYSSKDCNLAAINTMKKHGLEVGYGSHCNNPVTTFMSLCFNPSDILFYIKGEKDIIYPDDEHAIKLNEVNSFVEMLITLKDSIGTGIKKEMINRIEDNTWKRL